MIQLNRHVARMEACYVKKKGVLLAPQIWKKTLKLSPKLLQEIYGQQVKDVIETETDPLNLTE